jgi:hypothetical protein
MALPGTPLVVYYIDEAASGSSPTALVDSSGNAYDLTTVNYDAGNMAYVEPAAGQRGLSSTLVGSAARASRAIDNTADTVRTAMVGATKASIAIVCNLRAGNDSGGRIAGINGRAGENGAFIIKAFDASQYIAINDTNYDNGLTPMGAATNTGRGLLVFVFDSTQAVQNDRIKYSWNGGTLTQWTNTVALNATIALPADQDLIVHNRENAGVWNRATDSTVHFFALWAGQALDQTQVNDLHTELATNDDTPSAAVLGIYYIKA